MVIVLKDNVAVFVLLLGIYTSGHVVFVDTIGLRLELQVIMVVLAVFTLLQYLQEPNFLEKINKEVLLVLLLIVTLLIGEIWMRGRMNKEAGYLLAVALVLIIVFTDHRKIIQLVDAVNNINVIFALFALLGLFLSLYIPDVFNSILTRADYYNSKFPSGIGWYALLSQADGYNTIGEMKLLRVSAYLQQKSLLPAYILLPLSISLVFSKVRWWVVWVLLLLVLSTLSGTVYVSLLFVIVIYVLKDHVHKLVFVISPFVFLVVFLGVLYYQFYDIYDVNPIKETMRSLVVMDDNINPLANRLGSGFARLILIGFQVVEFVNVFPEPAGVKILSNTFGSNIMTNGLRGGVVGLLLSLVLYFALIKAVTEELVNKENSSNKTTKFGLSLMYSLIIQSMVYNDYGFSNYYGFLMFTIILILFSKRNIKEG